MGKALTTTGFQPHRGQATMLKWMAESPSKRFWTLRCPRQWGKTTLLLNIALDRLMNTPETYLWYITPFYKQTANIFKTKLMADLHPISRRVFKKINLSTFEIVLTNGSRMEFHSAENYESLRSATLDGMICDEFAYFRQGAWDAVLSPMLVVRGKLVIFASTPSGKNEFYTLCERGRYGGDNYLPEWASFKGDYTQTGNVKLIKEIEGKRKYTPEDNFRQEYEAEFVDGGGSVFKNVESFFSMGAWGLPTDSNYAGIDVGQNHDRTVITIFNTKGEVVFIKRFELNEQANAITLTGHLDGVIKRFPNTRTLIETNFNSGILDLLRAKENIVYPFVTTNQSKQEILHNLMFAMDAGLVRAPAIRETEQLRTEMNQMKTNLSAVRRDATYSAPSGGYDDCVMSLAIAMNALKRIGKAINFQQT